MCECGRPGGRGGGGIETMSRHHVCHFIVDFEIKVFRTRFVLFNEIDSGLILLLTA